MTHLNSMNTLKYSPYFVVTFLAVVMAGCTGEQSSSDAQPAGADIQVANYDIAEIEYPDLGDFEIPDPRRIELDNGLTVFLLEDHTLPQISAVARIGAGSVWEPAEMTGLAGITGTVMRTGGTADMDPEAVNQALADIGATVETGIGEDSGFAYMNTLTDSLDTVLPIFKGILTTPAFAEEKVQLAKSRFKSAISRRNDNPQGIAFREMSQLIYGEQSPYARVAQYYTVDRIQRQDLADFHDQYFHPNNTMLSIWGDFDTEQMAGRIRDLFGDWERGADFERPPLPPVDGDRDYSVYFIPKSDVTQSLVLMGHVGAIKKSNPDYFPVIVMNQVLSGGFTGRLFKNVRSEMGLAYAVFGNYSAGYARKGIFRAGVGTKSATTVEAAQAVLAQIKRMRQEPPTPEELELAKSAFLNAFVFNFDTRREILSRLMTYEYYDYPRDFLQQIKQGVEQVSADDVLRVSREYLNPDALDVLVLGNEEDIVQPLAVLARGGEVEQIDITIPTQPPGADEPAATEADLAAGRALLEEVKQALGGTAFADIENFSASSSSVVQTPNGEQTIESALAVSLPDQVNVQVTLPNGMALTIVSNGDQTILKTARGVVPAPPPLRRQTLGELWRDLTYLMVRAEEVDAAAEGEASIEGETYETLAINTPQGVNFTLQIDPQTRYPARIRYQAMTPQGPVETINVFSDYREVSGVMVPFKVVSYQDGEQRGVATVRSFEINTDLEPSLFALEQ